jgi:hypothetical protein
VLVPNRERSLWFLILLFATNVVLFSIFIDFKNSRTLHVRLPSQKVAAIARCRTAVVGEDGVQNN